MPSSTPFNLLMERKKPKGNTDELALVKAAAWAWYQHGSGSQGKPIGESDLPRNCRVPGPSRYKLEAMRIAQDAMEEGSQTPSPIHTDNSLLDSYEIGSITRQLDHYMESSGTKFFRGLLASDHDRHKNVSSNGGKSGMRKKNKIFKRFWPRHAVCGTRDDVDTTAFVRRPEKHAPVVRPRATHA